MVIASFRKDVLAMVTGLLIGGMFSAGYFVGKATERERFADFLLYLKVRENGVAAPQMWWHEYVTQDPKDQEGARQMAPAMYETLKMMLKEKGP